MAKRRAFVPAAPHCSSLEERIAPANVFGLGSWWDKTVDRAGFRHHHNTSNVDIVANTWKHSKILSQPTHAVLQGTPTPAHHAPVVFHK